jgi:hypothetical protein
MSIVPTLPLRKEAHVCGTLRYLGPVKGCAANPQTTTYLQEGAIDLDESMKGPWINTGAKKQWLNASSKKSFAHKISIQI